jgi:hypothetical protein
VSKKKKPKKKKAEKVDWVEMAQALQALADDLARWRFVPVRKPKYVKRIRP